MLSSRINVKQGQVSQWKMLMHAPSAELACQQQELCTPDHISNRHLAQTKGA